MYNMKKYIEVLSPVNGTISNITENSIQIYIEPIGNHQIYAPISGTVSNISNVEGSWTRNIFQTNVNKTGRTEIDITNPIIKNPVSLWLEVGKPKYIVDKIRINITKNDEVKIGELVGEILLGSLAELHFDNLETIKVVDIGSKVIGHKTIIAHICYT